jgi:hypothetical protein
VSTTDLPNAYTVRVHESDGMWEVHVVAPNGTVESVRHCVDEPDARTFASTVQQHIYWLSPAKFREYYRLEQPA